MYKELDCLSAVRDSLFAFAENLIDDVQFAVLYDDNRSKPSFHTGRLIAFPWTIWTRRIGRSAALDAVPSNHNFGDSVDN